MKIVLTPDHQNPKQLRLLYKRAFREAQELFVATAYLTNWDTTRRVTSKCKRLTFIAGTDFGLTRKFALRQVLKWLPKHGSTVFGAVSLDRMALSIRRCWCGEPSKAPAIA